MAATTGSSQDVLLPKILFELKSLSSKFDTQCEVLDSCLNAITNSVTTVENSLTGITQHTLLEARLDDTEGTIVSLESRLPANELLINSLKERVAHLESKVDDIENRGRCKNICRVGQAEGGEVLVLNFSKTCYQCGWTCPPVILLRLKKLTDP